MKQNVILDVIKPVAIFGLPLNKEKEAQIIAVLPGYSVDTNDTEIIAQSRILRTNQLVPDEVDKMIREAPKGKKRYMTYAGIGVSYDPQNTLGKWMELQRALILVIEEKV